MNRIMRWDVFCHVIDNFGDAGVCWRLCALLAREAQDHVTLWIDKPELLLSLAPPALRPHNIDVRPWHVSASDAEVFQLDKTQAPDVVIETFGCRTPESYKEWVNNSSKKTQWINLEYLSAEGYVARSHGLPSPVQSGALKGQTQWFFYPGFSEGTGGIMHADAPAELGPARNQAFIFSYENESLIPLCVALVAHGIKPQIAAGRTTDYVQTHFSDQLRQHCDFVPLVPQSGFDALLAGNALNVVRGEDSFVRAQLAARPFIWHIYPQHDLAHRAKLLAFFKLYADGLGDEYKAYLWDAWHHFNEGSLTLELANALLQNMAVYIAHALKWRDKLLQREDMVAQLRGFLRSKAE